MPSVLLIRHAQASFGAADYDLLSSLGHRQCAALNAALLSRGVTARRIVSGDLRRQTETAATLPLAAGGSIGVDSRWNEYDTDQILTAHSSTGARLDSPTAGVDGLIDSRQFQQILDLALHDWVRSGELSSAAQDFPVFAARALEALDDAFRSLRDGELGIVVSSGGAIAAVCDALLGGEGQGFVSLNRVQVNTGISKILRGRTGSSLATFNEHSHLEGEGRSLITYR